MKHTCASLIRLLVPNRQRMPLARTMLLLTPTNRPKPTPASPATRAITATLVRQIAAMRGDVTAFVPADVAAALKAKFSS